MTKITLRPNEPAVAPEVLDLDQSRTRRAEPVAPLDQHRALVGQLVQAQVCQLRRGLDPVQVDVRELHPAGVDAHQLEGRAGDGRG